MAEALDASGLLDEAAKLAAAQAGPVEGLSLIHISEPTRPY